MSNRAGRVTYGLWSAEFVRAYVRTMRPYLLFVSGITGLAGAAFSDTISRGALAAVGCASFFSYGFGQALTDCFQIDTDSISSPYRPLTQGLVSKRAVLLVSICGLGSCILVFASLNSRTLILGIAAGMGLLTYTYFKRRWWGGPLYNAWIVACLCAMAYNCGAPGGTLAPPDGLLLAAVLFGYANFVLSGYFKDIAADRKTGYRTMPVVFGRNCSALVSDGLAILAFLASAAIVTRDAPHTLAGLPVELVLLAGAVSTILSQILLHRATTDTEAHMPIAMVLHSYILLLSAAILSHRPGWFLPLAMFYGAFNLALGARPERSQI